MTDRSPVESSEWRKVALLAACLLLPAYLATASWSSLQSLDPRSAALAGWQVAKTGSLAFESTWIPGSYAWPAEGADGSLYSNRFPGVIALSAAAYCAAELTGVLPDNDTDLAIDLPMWPATLMAVLVAVLAAVLTWRLFRETSVSPSFALAAAGLVALGSPLWSVSADALWTHGATHVLLAGALLALAGGRVGVVSVLGAAAILFRPHLAVAVLVVAVFQRDWRSRATVAGGAALGIGVLAGYSMWIFGQPLPAAGYSMDQLVRGMPLDSPTEFLANLVDWLFDPRRGVLVLVPTVLLAVPRMPSAWGKAPSWIRVGAVAGAAYALAQIGLSRASGGTWFFGHRTTIETLVLASPLLVLSISEFTTRMRSVGRVTFLVAVGFSLLAHGYGAVVDIPAGAKQEMIEEQEELRRQYSQAAVIPPVATLESPRAVRRTRPP